MKKHLSLTMAILFALMACACITVLAADSSPVYDTELFLGGDVETANEAEGTFGGNWANGFYVNAKGAASLETTEVHSGKNAIKLVATNQGGSDFANVYGAYQSANQPESTTQAHGWIKVAELSEGSYITVNLYKGTLGDSRSLYAVNTFNTVGDWKEFMCVTDTDFVGLVYLEVRFYGTGTCYIDDVSVKDVQNLLSPQFGMNFFNNVHSGTSVLGSNHYLTEEEHFAGRQSLFLGWTSSKTSPRISAWLTSPRSQLKPGKKYHLSFRFKPAVEDGGSPMLMFGKGADAYSNRYLTLDYYWNSLQRGNVINGWQEYHAYFTMPNTVDTAQMQSIMLACYGEANNGYYDAFSLTPDAEGDVKVESLDGIVINTAKAGSTVVVKKHVISDKTKDEGGKKVTLAVAVYKEVDGKKQCVCIDFAEKAVFDGVEYYKPEKNGGDYLYTNGADDVTCQIALLPEYAGCTLKAFAFEDGAKVLPAGATCAISVLAE